MDTRNGQIYDPADPDGKEMLKRLMADPRTRQFIKPMQLPPTPVQLSRRPPRVGRNDPCPCGSGKKFKKCCLALARRNP